MPKRWIDENAKWGLHWAFMTLLGDKQTHGRKLAPMSEKRSGKSHATAWALSILAVPVLYVLSVPPIWVAGLRKWGEPPPELLLDYATPYVWMEENTPLKSSLRAYFDWCLRLPGPIRPE
jgi:hypothetical protein